jgi:hypothetical protein
MKSFSLFGALALAVVALGFLPLGTSTALAQIFNNRVTFEQIESTFMEEPPEGCPDGFEGKFSFDARLTNISDGPLADIVVEPKALTDGNLLQNADDAPAGVGAILTVLRKDGFSDGVLGPGEFVDVHFSICLKEIKPFEFFNDVSEECKILRRSQSAGIVTLTTDVLSTKVKITGLDSGTATGTTDADGGISIDGGLPIQDLNKLKCVVVP